MSTEPLIEIKLDEAKLRNIQQLLRNIPKAFPRVISRAINRTATPIKTSMSRQLIGPINAEASAIRGLQKQTGRNIPNLRFKISDMKNNIRIQKATYSIWQALLWIKRFKGQEDIESTQPSFVAQMPSGHISIFKRLEAARLPIADQLRRLMREYFAGIGSQVKQEAQQRLEHNINDQVKLALSQWKAASGRAA